MTNDALYVCTKSVGEYKEGLLYAIDKDKAARYPEHFHDATEQIAERIRGYKGEFNPWIAETASKMASDCANPVPDGYYDEMKRLGENLLRLLPRKEKTVEHFERLFGSMFTELENTIGPCRMVSVVKTGTGEAPKVVFDFEEKHQKDI